MPASMRFTLIGCLALFLLAPPASAQVKVKKEKPTIETKTFDPKNPPTDAPLDGHPAVTTAFYKISGNMKFSSTTKKTNSDGTATAGIRAAGFDLKLELAITYWLPDDVSEKLKAHEAGHKKIAEHMYADAEKTARAIGKDYIGKAGSGSGEDYQKAANAALGQMMKDLAADYSKATTDRVKRLNTIYDELTEGGRGPMPEDDAVEEALKREAEEYAKAKAEASKPMPKKPTVKPKAPAAEEQ